ncbi:MAG: protein-L-isoaspartate(D-aspartate) O-methyltransferase [Candidatus Omnitrophica bacterium]|nr:protein-L-isoaspartate(D-aspartate) O-methyltransferase [Candidatus Omnitrophota bacterium]
MDYETLRNRMVQEQLVSRGIHDEKVLHAFLRTPRHLFIPEAVKINAYSDFPLAIGEGQTISQPYIVALMTQQLELTGNEKVLEIGTGSGYQTAILSEMVKEVLSVERFESLAKKAAAILADLGCNNVKLKAGDGSLGWPEEAPFDRIIVTAASPKVPLPLIDQLKNGGKLIIPIGESYSQMLTKIEKKENNLISTDICACVFVPLIGKFGTKNE